MFVCLIYMCCCASQWKSEHNVSVLSHHVDSEDQIQLVSLDLVASEFTFLALSLALNVIYCLVSKYKIVLFSCSVLGLLR